MDLVVLSFLDIVKIAPTSVKLKAIGREDQMD